MENKYYTPSIEELHSGFKCEIRTDRPNDTWSNHTWYSKNFGDLEGDWISVRVKYLDKEDIESLGWKYEKTNHIRFWYTGNESWFNNTIPDSPSGRYWGFELCHDPEMKTICIRCKDNGGEWEYYYQGICKNKSELNRLMQQLGIK